MADFRLGRLKFNWRGDWQASTAYVIDDIIAFKGNTYVCVVNHTSASDETQWDSTDYDIATPKWETHVPGTRMMGAWTVNTFYAVNDLVSFGANQYLCVDNHTSPAGEDLFYATSPSWSLYLSSVEYKGSWSNGVYYKLNDIVRYGNSLYLCNIGHTSGISFDETKYNVYLESLTFEDSWSNAVEYQPGDIVNFGGYTYVAKTIHTNLQPNANTAAWDILTTGFDVKGEYADATEYVPGDVVQFGGNTFVKIVTGNAGVNPTDTSAWTIVSSGLNWKGPWQSSATYQVNDVVSRQSASWVNLTADNTNINPVGDNGTNWEALSQGESVLTLEDPGDILYRNSAGANVPLKILNVPEGDVLAVTDSGQVDAQGNKIMLPAWQRDNWCANVYYVATDGTDDPDFGKNISKPWKTIRYALAQTANTGTADSVVTIFVKTGSYEEQLPLITTPFTTIIGDNLRATIIKPDPNTQSSDSTPIENRFSTMFFLSEGVTLKDLVMVGMEGFTPASGANNSWDITQATIRGVFLRLHPNDPITTKSPYITQCSAFSGRPTSGDDYSGGGVGAIIDRSIYSTTSVGSILVDSFTQLHDGGVGFWCKDLGNAEIVSSFTYYAHIGYTCTGGGRLRSLSGNNSYGEYGAVSSGTDQTETALTGTVRGERLNFVYDEFSLQFKKFEQVVQGEDDGAGNIDYTGSNANYALALVLNVQEDYLIIEPITGTFGNGFPIKGVSSSTVTGSGATGVTDSTAALVGITGNIFTMDNLPVVNGVADIPKQTASTNFLDVSGQSQYDDDGFYVVSEVTDSSTAQNLSITTLRQYDVPGVAPTAVEISTIGYSSDTVTIVTSSAHGLSTGQEVVVVIANAVFQPYASTAFERETVTIIDGTTFTYSKPGLNDVAATSQSGSKVYLQSISGGSTKANASGGTDVDLYNISSTTTRLDLAGTQSLGSSLSNVEITFADPSILGGMSTGSNNFILIGNEMMEIAQINTGVGVEVVRASEGTAAAEHADGSVVYYVTKSAASTTLKGDINTGDLDLPIFSIANFDANDIIKIGSEFLRITSVNSALVGQATITFSRPKTVAASSGQAFEMRLNYSQVRLTGHDFLLIGTGNKTQTNWPDQPLQEADQGNEVYEDYPGRVYYVSTDQDGNFRVGSLFWVEQATGVATLDANDFNLSGLASLQLGTIGAELGASINEFSTDVTLGAEFSRDTACPTQLAVKTYVDGKSGSGIGRTSQLVSVAELASSGTTATVTSALAHNVFVDDEVIISGAAEANYNGTFTVASIDVANKQFTYVMSGVAGTPATPIGAAIVCERKQKVATDLDVVGNTKTRPTWNESSTVFNAVDIDVTDTISQSTSNLIKADVGGSTKFAVDKAGNITAAGNLTVAGTTTTVNSTNLEITDKEIIIGSGAGDAAAADGAGIVIGTSGKSFKYNDTNTRWDLTDKININTALQIGGTEVLSANTLGAGIATSSLTSVGALTGLTVNGMSSIRSVEENVEVMGANASGNQTYDFANQVVYFHPSVAGNLTAAFTNVPETSGVPKAYAVAIAVVQSGSPYNFTNSVGISNTGSAGSSYTVQWAGGTAPTGNASTTDVWSFSLIYDGSTWHVYGSASTFS